MQSNSIAVSGYCDPRFLPLREAFAASFAVQAEPADQELGASLCVIEHGRTVVDLWGGVCDPEGQRPWTGCTAGLCFSATKAFTALVIHKLIEKGDLTMQTPIAEIWQEFGCHGKQEVTIADVLTHSAGVPHVRTGTRGLGFEQSTWEAAIAEAPPLHPPGARHIYHALTQGYILNAVARRVTGGHEVQDLFHAWFCDEAGVEITFGLAGRAPRDVFVVAPVALPRDLPEPSPLSREIMSQAALPIDWNSREFLGAVVPAGNAVATARDIAKLYAALLRVDSPLGAVQLQQARSLAWAGIEESSRKTWRMGFGLMLASDFTQFGPSRAAFGHPGMGGATGFADPEAGLAVSYLPNRPDPRGAQGRFAKLAAVLRMVLSYGT
jgi:CubicO group peptidase (beta-lactamase class C family)